MNSCQFQDLRLILQFVINFVYFKDFSCKLNRINCFFINLILYHDHLDMHLDDFLFSYDLDCLIQMNNHLDYFNLNQYFMIL